MSCHLPVNETVIAKGRDIKICTGLKLEETQHQNYTDNAERMEQKFIFQ